MGKEEVTLDEIAATHLSSPHTSHNNGDMNRATPDAAAKAFDTLAKAVQSPQSQVHLKIKNLFSISRPLHQSTIEST